MNAGVELTKDLVKHQNLSISMADASVRGYQGTSLIDYGNILACAKHFLGDGGTQGGDDQGNVVADEQTVRNFTYKDLFLQSMQE